MKYIPCENNEIGVWSTPCLISYSFGKRKPTLGSTNSSKNLPKFACEENLFYVGVFTRTKPGTSGPFSPNKFTDRMCLVGHFFSYSFSTGTLLNPEFQRFYTVEVAGRFSFSSGIFSPKCLLYILLIGIFESSD